MSGTQELQKVLDLFEARIAAVENKVGGAPPPPDDRSCARRGWADLCDGRAGERRAEGL